MDSEIYNEMDRIKQRIKQIKDEYPSTVWVGEKDKIGTKPMPPEVREELEQLSARLQELKKEDDKTQGLI